MLCLMCVTASASGTGVVVGRVYDADGGSISEAIVVALGSDAHDSTDGSGRFVLDSVPESSVILASARGFFDETVSVRVAAGCTSKTSLLLMDQFGTRPDRFALEPSETLLVQSRMDDPKLHVDTIPWFMNTADTSVRKRSNSTKLTLVAHCAGGSVKVAYAEAYARPLARHMWLATGTGQLGPGMGYLRERLVAFYYASEGLSRTYTHTTLSQVTSVAVGYIVTSSLGGMEFVQCGEPYPEDRWLVLRLEFLGGGTAFF